MSFSINAQLELRTSFSDELRSNYFERSICEAELPLLLFAVKSNEVLHNPIS